MFSGVCVFSNTSSSASQFLRNVTSGWFLEADQQREINVPLRGHMHVPPLLRRIIDEECDITQKYFRLCRSNCPQLKGMAGEGRGAFRRNLSTLVETLKAKLQVLTLQHHGRIMGLLVCSAGAHTGFISG